MNKIDPSLSLFHAYLNPTNMQSTKIEQFSKSSLAINKSQSCCCVSDCVIAIFQAIGEFFNWLFYTQSTVKETPLPFPPQNGKYYSHDELKMIWKQTEEVIQNGGYTLNGKKHDFSKEFQQSVQTAKVYETVKKLKNPVFQYDTEIVVVNRGIIEEGIYLKNKGYNPVLLNPACATHPGGGVKKGDHALEETLCRQSNLFETLNPKFYPINNHQAIYSKDIVVFRNGSEKNYAFLEKPVTLSFISSASIREPKLTKKGKFNFTDFDLMKGKIRTQLHAAKENGHDAVVLVAFGCGAFKVPPKLVVDLYLSIIKKEYPNTFKVISFAVIDDHNSGKAHNPEGNFKPFADAIKEAGGKVIQ